MADRFDVVAVGVKHKGAVIVGVVLGAQAGGAVVLGARLDGRGVEPVCSIGGAGSPYASSPLDGSFATLGYYQTTSRLYLSHMRPSGCAVAWLESETLPRFLVRILSAFGTIKDEATLVATISKLELPLGTFQCD